MAGPLSLPSAANGQSASFPEKRWALVVGVDQAPSSKQEPLDYGVNDAREMAEALHEHCGFELVCEPLLDEAARSADVLQALIRKLIANRTDNDFLLFYFAGHGIAYRRGEHIEETDIYLGACDFSPQDVQFVRDAHISLKLLRELLFEQCVAGKVLIILDCCNAGNISGYGADLTLDELRTLLSRYFDTLNLASAATMRGLRLALAATTYNRPARERDGHGELTRYLLRALKGEANEAIDYAGRVSFQSVRIYLQDAMRDEPPSGSGADAGRECILAYHSKHPTSYFPYGHNALFKPREGEFEALEPVLRGEHGAPVRLGLVGMGGVGKSGLARELVCRNEAYFSDGVFWVTAGEDHADKARADGANPLLHPLATLASKTGYLPPGDDSTRPNEELRARHLCRFLAQLPHALLILDNLDDPTLVTTALPDLAGTTLRCAILYTSRQRDRVHGVQVHVVEPLDNEQDQLALLLEGVRPAVLERARAGQRDEEVEAARSICLRVGGLVLALTLLRSQLEQNEWLTLSDLDRQLSEHGVLAVARDESAIHQSLEATFRLSWQHVGTAMAQRLFQFAAYFPPATPISLWLLALVCGVAEDYALHSPLMEARSLLRRLSLIEDVSRTEVQMHSLLHAFGQKLLADTKDGQAIRRAAAERVIADFEDVRKLEQRVRELGFWDCLAQIRAARIYVATLQPGADERLRRVERRLDQETYFLATSGLWPQQLPGLFYQQMYNRILEEGPLPPITPIPVAPPTTVETRFSPSDLSPAEATSEVGGQGSKLDGINPVSTARSSALSPTTPWLRQLERVGIRDTGLIRVFSGHSKGVNSVAFSPDGAKVLTGSEDMTARIFETASGRTLHILSGHTGVLDSVAYSPDGSCVLTGSRDCTARLWDAESGECMRVLEGHTDWVNAVAFSPDGKLVATGSQDGMARLWERETGNIHISFSTNEKLTVFYTLSDEANDLYGIMCVAFSPNNTHVALGVKWGEVFLWDITNDTYSKINWKDIDSIPYHIKCLAYSPDGSKLLVSSTGGKILLWDCIKSAIIRKFDLSLGFYPSMSFSHDPTGTYFLSGAWDGLVRLWATDSGEVLHVFEKCSGAINSVTFSPDDTTILIGSSDRTAQLWERTKDPSTTFGETYAINGNNAEKQPIEQAALYPLRAAFSPDASRLVGISRSYINIWDVQRRQKLAILIKEAISAFHFHRDTIMIMSNYKIRVFDLNSGELLQTNPLRDGDHANFDATFSHDGRYVFVSTRHNVARLWSTSTGRIIKTLKGHTDTVMSVAFSPDDTQLLTGSWDKTARLWKKRGRTYIPTILSGHGGAVIKVAFSSDGTKAFTGSTDALLRMWDTANGNLLGVLDGQIGEITLIASSPDSKYVLAGDMFNQVRVWRCEEPFALVGAFSTHGRLLAAHWRDERTILLVDDAPTNGFPRMYTLRLEG